MKKTVKAKKQKKKHTKKIDNPPTAVLTGWPNVASTQA
jgi:hypothetical protein